MKWPFPPHWEAPRMNICADLLFGLIVLVHMTYNGLSIYRWLMVHPTYIYTLHNIYKWTNSGVIFHWNINGMYWYKKNRLMVYRSLKGCNISHNSHEMIQGQGAARAASQVPFLARLPVGITTYYTYFIHIIHILFTPYIHVIYTLYIL